MSGFFRRMFGGDPPPPPPKPVDLRAWNDDWQVGDTAECVVDFYQWHEAVKPWNRPPKGARLIVSGFTEGVGNNGETLEYFLFFEGRTVGLSTRGFRKVRPIATENSEIVERILKAKPGKDKKRPARAPLPKTTAKLVPLSSAGVK